MPAPDNAPDLGPLVRVPPNLQPGQKYYDGVYGQMRMQDTSTLQRLIKYDRHYLVRRTSVVAETFHRYAVGGGQTVLVSGTAFLQAIPLFGGDLVSNITFVSGTTAAGTPTHWWFVLADANRVVRAVTADQLTAAWAASTEKVLAVGTPYTIPSDALYYVGVMVAATTVPNIIGVGGNATINALAPILSGASSTAQTTAPALGATLTAITASASQFYANVS